ncbi:hypothetical protein L1049_026469 [Liquidambar formosana]|uniref:Uncharacterized protein n=1 Tax=Liquidambar formosana TaxID=63359 RepID=A0AAP0R7W8_LIQFO
MILINLRTVRVICQEDATKGDDNTETSQYESNSDAVEKQNLSENTVEENQEEKSEEKTEAKEEPETGVCN